MIRNWNKLFFLFNLIIKGFLSRQLYVQNFHKYIYIYIERYIILLNDIFTHLNLIMNIQDKIDYISFYLSLIASKLRSRSKNKLKRYLHAKIVLFSHSMNKPYALTI